MILFYQMGYFISLVPSLSEIMMMADDKPSLLTSGSKLDKTTPTVSVSSSTSSSLIITSSQIGELDGNERV